MIMANQPLNKWNVSNVRDIEQMFNNANVPRSVDQKKSSQSFRF